MVNHTSNYSSGITSVISSAPLWPTAIQVAAINTAMSSLVKTLNVFPRERMIVNRERAQQSYSTLPYLTAKLVAELPVGEP